MSWRLNRPARLWLLLLAVFASAARAEICYSSDAIPSSSTIFNCPQAGNRNLSQLAQQGYQVRQLSPRAGAAGLVWQLVLQRSELIFRSRFES